jgi:manganese transport protein
MKFSLGPGAMVAAAFIGPGTLTTATAAGAATGMSLVWAICLSIIATLVLQELAVRLALATNMDLAQLIRHAGIGRWWRLPVIALVVIAIGVGNAAYQSGNLSGAAIGFSAAFSVGFDGVVILTSAFACSLILLDQYRVLERVLVALVGVMALLFMGLAFICLPALASLEPHRLMPGGSMNEITLVLALIGTTVVPYNLFLHATAARRRWQGISTEEAIKEARRESRLAIITGGCITVAIMAVAAAVLAADTREGVIDALIRAVNLRFLGLGTWIVGGGLFAAGLTSAIAAPVAAGWAVSGVLGYPTDPHSGSFKWVSLSVLFIGGVFSMLTERPISLIVTAQAANALALPIIAGLLLVLANHKLVPVNYRNSLALNLATGFVIALVGLLSATKIFGILQS